MESGDARKLRQLEEENHKLKHVLAELTLDNRALKDVLSKVSSAYGTAKSHCVRHRKASDERTARLQAHRPGMIDASVPVAESRTGAALRMRLKELTVQAMRFGYRRLTVMLARSGMPVNHKRVYRLYREEGLAMRVRSDAE